MWARSGRAPADACLRRGLLAPSAAPAGRRRCGAGAPPGPSAGGGGGPREPPGPGGRWAEKRADRDRHAHRDRSLDPYEHRRATGSQGRFDPSAQPGHTDQRLATAQVHRLGRRRRWEEALVVFGREPAPNPALYTAALDACCRSLQQRAAWELFRQMPQRTLPAYNSMVGLQARLKQVAGAVDLVRELREEARLQPDVVTFTNLIVAHGAVHDVPAALEVLRAMPDAAVVPDKIAYGAAMSACSKAGERDHTVSLLREMEDRLLRPDITHLTCVLVACALSKDEAAARQAFAELRRRSFEPDAVAYTSLISCFAGADALRKADAVLAEMLAATVHPTVVTYNAVLQVAIREGATDRAQGLAAEMEQRGVPANGETAALLEQLRESPRACAAHGALAAEASGALPAPWRETVDPSSGRRYYWQDSDPAGTVTWDRPR